MESEFSCIAISTSCIPISAGGGNKVAKLINGHMIPVGLHTIAYIQLEMSHHYILAMFFEEFMFKDTMESELSCIAISTSFIPISAGGENKVAKLINVHMIALGFHAIAYIHLEMSHHYILSNVF